MQVRVQAEGLVPGVQHRDEADLGAQVFRVGGDRAQRLGGGPEQVDNAAPARARYTSLLAEDLRHAKERTSHGGPGQCVGTDAVSGRGSKSSGLVAEQTLVVAKRR